MVVLNDPFHLTRQFKFDPDATGERGSLSIAYVFVVLEVHVGEEME